MKRSKKYKYLIRFLILLLLVVSYLSLDDMYIKYKDGSLRDSSIINDIFKYD